MPEPTPSAPDTAARSWVWHATVESREAGKVSVLACVETLVAVALYWWIAIRWDTHWHLLTSVFIAPLLLLRSPESIKLGVQWFMKDWFGFKDYKEWPKARRWLWMGGVATVSGMTTYTFACWWCGLWLVGQVGWALWGWSALIGCLSLAFAGVVADIVAGVVAGVVTGVDAVAGLVLVAVAGVVAIVGVVVAMDTNQAGVVVVLVGLVAYFVAVVFVFVVIAVFFGAGLSLRGLVFRVAATLRHLPLGVRRLADNWQENNFWVDSCVPAELMPGIGEENERFTFAGLVRYLSQVEREKWHRGAGPLLAVCLFLPAFLYRLNIKATCWFWWPLAYLLKPVPQEDKASRQKQALCWPWDNPLQMLLILVPGVLVLGILIVEYCDFSVWKEFKNGAAVPIPLKVVLGMGWSHIPLWHWALFIVEVTGLGMLYIAGTARSHRASDNWESYAQSGMQRDLWLMDKLMRLRGLAAKGFMLLGLGMCLISFPQLRQWVPDAVMLRMDRFYHAQELHEPALAGQPLH